MVIGYASLCDGAGAAHPALQTLGWECVLTSEIDPFPAAVVEYHFGLRNMGCMRTYRDWPEDLLADIGVLLAGTPCQPFSVAGRRRGLVDDRGGLTLELVNAWYHINTIRRKHERLPAILVWENVPNILSMRDNSFGHFLGGLLGCDEVCPPEGGKWGNAGFYSNEHVRVGYRVLDAQYFAVAQRRRRVFLLAVPSEVVDYFGEGTCPSQIFSFGASEAKPPQTRRRLRQEAAAAAQGGTREGTPGPHRAEGRDGTHDGRMIDGSGSCQVAFAKSARPREKGGCETWVEADVSPTLTPFESGEARAPTLVVPVPQSSSPQEPSQEIGGASSRASSGLQGERVSLTVDGRDQPLDWEPQGVLRGSRGGGDGVVIGSTDIAYTLTASRGSGFRSNGTATQSFAIANGDVRRTIPREWESLMGFPDGYTDIPYRNGAPAADSLRYKALGNSVVVPILHYLGKRIQAAMDSRAQG